MTRVRYKKFSLIFFFELQWSYVHGCDSDLYQLKFTFSVCSWSYFTMTTKPNWQAYLMKRPYLLWLRDHSTHWRATCRYDTDGTVYTDYLRASLEDFDIIRDLPIVTDDCRRYEYMGTSGEMSVWIVQHGRGINDLLLCIWTVPITDLANLTEVR